jgi:hypothetical protein
MQKLLQILVVASAVCAVGQEKITPNPVSNVLRLEASKPPIAFRDALDLSAWKWAKWTNSFLVVHNSQASRQSFAAAAYDSEGNLKVGTTAWVEGAADESLSDATMTKNGSLVVSGGTASQDGKITNFIGQTDKSGTLVRILTTNPHVPIHICAVGDRVWSYGWVRQRNEVSKPILYEYDLEKGLQFSALDRYTFIPPNTRFTMTTQVEMGCNDNEVVLFLGPSNKVVRVNAKTKAIKTINVPVLFEKTNVTGVAVTDDGHVFLSVIVHEEHQPSQVFRLSGDDKNGQWLPVEGSSGTTNQTEDGVLKLLGTEGNELVLSGRGKLNSHLLWSRVSETNGK